MCVLWYTVTRSHPHIQKGLILRWQEHFKQWTPHPVICVLCYTVTPHHIGLILWWQSFKQMDPTFCDLPLSMLLLLVQIQRPPGYGTDLNPGRLIRVFYWPHIDRTHRWPDRSLYTAAASSGFVYEPKNALFLLQGRTDYILFGACIIRRRRFTRHWITWNLYLNLVRLLPLNFSSMVAT
jgi:hypothetical protein